MPERISNYNLYAKPLSSLTIEKKLICTINAHSYNIAKKDELFRRALESSTLIPDGVSIVAATRWISGKKIHKIAGADLFFYEMNRLNLESGKCFFLGSSAETLQQIEKRVRIDYPNIQVMSYSPPYKPEFTAPDNLAMIQAVNAFEPDVLMVGMTAPKQEKWSFENYGDLKTGHICCIGAVFDFYAGTINRAPEWMIKLGLEWFYRLIKEPKRMWKRYLVGNVLFVWYMILEKIKTPAEKSAGGI